MNLATLTLPTHWASYLINGDASGLDDDDILAVDACLAYAFPDGAHCLDVAEEHGFMRDHDARGHGVQACDCATFTFDVTP